VVELTAAALAAHPPAAAAQQTETTAMLKKYTINGAGRSLSLGAVRVHFTAHMCTCNLISRHESRIVPHLAG